MLTPPDALSHSLCRPVVGGDARVDLVGERRLEVDRQPHLVL
jgi:hypothetical protein